MNKKSKIICIISLIILVLCFISVVSLMTVSISGEMKKIDSMSLDYKEKLIRFHVLANSDSDVDQDLKLRVKDEVLKYISPILNESQSLEESREILKREDVK